MALGDPYVTLAQLKSYMGITGTANDSDLTDALNTASRAIEQFCRRQFNDAGSASARAYYADSYNMVEVADFSTTTGLVVKIDTGDDGTFDTTWTTSDYQLLPLNGVVGGEAGWPYSTIVAGLNRYFPVRTHRPSVQVTAQWGWAAVPAPVAQACKILAQETYELKGSPFGVRQYGDYAMRLRDNPKVASMLAPYQRDSVLVA